MRKNLVAVVAVSVLSAAPVSAQYPFLKHACMIIIHNRVKL